MAAQSKFDPVAREMAEKIFRETSFSRNETVKFLQPLGATARSVQWWWSRLEKPPHRGGQGTTPQKLLEALQKELAEKTERIRILESKIVESCLVTPESLMIDLLVAMKGSINSPIIASQASALRAVHAVIAGKPTEEEPDISDLERRVDEAIKTPIPASSKFADGEIPDPPKDQV